MLLPWAEELWQAWARDGGRVAVLAQGCPISRPDQVTYTPTESLYGNRMFEQYVYV